MKKIISCLSISLIFISFLSHPMASTPSVHAATTIHLADSQASNYTKALFSYLQSTSGQHILFGHQHATDEGLTLTNDPPRVASEQSEVLNAVGDYPAIFGWDTLSIDGFEKPGIEGDVPQSIDNLAASMKKAHELGGVIVLSMHPMNFATGGDFYDTSGETVTHILPGGKHHNDFTAWLDNIATLAHKVKDENGESIPIIFRPFHEQTGAWFWWGAHQTTPEQYKALFRFTVEYLRDTKDVHNFLYVFSPGAGPAGDVERYLETYPGDEYVDILGIDNYDSPDNAGSDEWINGLVTDLAMLVDLADERGKIPALTEFGYSASGMSETDVTLDWFTRVFGAIKDHPKARNIAYMQTWANFGWPDNVFVPYKDVNGDLGGDHELLPDFQAFEADDYSAFRNQIQNQIYTDEHIAVDVADSQPNAYVVSPLSGSFIISNEETLRVRVNHDTPEKVTYTVEGSDTTHELTYNPETNYYEATWRPAAKFNGSSTNLTFQVTHRNGSVYEESVKVFVKASNLPVKIYTFDEKIDGVQFNGTYPETDSSNIDHLLLEEDGKLRFQVGDMPVEETWQELKLELTDLTSDEIQQTNQVSLEVLLPTSAGDGTIQAVVQYPDDWDTKYGMSETIQPLEELEEVVINGAVYKKYEASIHAPSPEGARSIAISIVGSQLDFSNPIYIDNIRLDNTFAEEPANPLLVDNFESYLGDQTLLSNAYSSNGDKVTLSLTTDQKNNGEYGLAYDFTIASMGYSGRQTSLGNRDWSETNAIQFWLKHEEYPNDLTIQIQIGGVSFEAYRPLNKDFNGIVTIPFTEFEPAPWENKPNVIIDKDKLTNVTQFSIYTGGEQGEGTLYFDDILAVHDASLPEVPGADDSPETEREPILFDFEDGHNDWSIVGGDATEPIITNDGINSSSLQFSFELNPEDKIELTTASIPTLFNEDEISAKLRLSAGSVIAKLFVKTGEDWSWYDSGDFLLKSGDVQTLTWSLENVNNVEHIQAFGFEFIPVDGDGTALITIDDITLNLEDQEESVEEDDETDNPSPDNNQEPEKELKEKLSQLENRLADLENKLTNEDNLDINKIKEELKNIRNEYEMIGIEKANIIKQLEFLEDQLNMASKETDKGNKGTSNNSDDADSKSKDVPDNDSAIDGPNNKLPNTSTSMWNYLLIGSALFLIGLCSMYLMRIKRLER
ncbi:mannan endo-1,4-beta-mannosidase [Gracilibacillus halotolerans]|uniref:Mannan endo-1,4-beta-mannosidase n=1 Tax=Gracilibacillus halotolerans TaxID=74386 RepID=A0A841RUS5_9BACI|nr:glycosyl hydrolase [Gracilibacillus halotolerans]MBB6514218.1 mannan endo-1,4-beta-mannosidase [Gracilibacillus halotolerans]